MTKNQHQDKPKTVLPAGAATFTCPTHGTSVQKRMAVAQRQDAAWAEIREAE